MNGFGRNARSEIKPPRIGDLPEPVRGQSGEVTGSDELLMSVQELQQRHVMRVLECVGGNKSQAAEIVGISRATIYQLLADAKVGKAS